MQLGERARARLTWAVRAVFAVAIVAFLVKAGIDNVDQLRTVEFEPQPGWAIVGIPFTFAAGLALPLAWRHVLYAYGAELDQATAVRVWCVSQAARFVPGSVALVASRVVLAQRVGIPRSLGAASVAVELGLMLTWAAVLVSWLPSYWVPGGWRILLAVAGTGALIGAPWLFRLVGRFLPRFPAISPDALRIRHLYEAIGLYGMNDLLRCAGFVFVTASFHTIDPSDVFWITGTVNAAAIVGMIGITPAGLGVREGAIAALLAPRFGLGTSAAIAVGMRLWDFLFELVWLALSTAWERRSKRLGSEVVEVAPGDVPPGAPEASD